MKVLRFGPVLVSIQRVDDQNAFPKKDHEVIGRPTNKDLILRISPDDRVGYEFVDREGLLKNEL